MFKVTPNQKQIDKYFYNTSQLQPVPQNWEDFIGLTQIRSGSSMVQFKPYYYQKLISKLMDEYNNIVVVKSRQLGITQVTLGKFLHRASLNPAYTAMSFLRNSEDASAISRRTRQMLSCLNDYVIADNDNVGYLKLKGLGEMYFKNSSKEGSRSYDSVQNFLFDEVSFSHNIQEIVSASSPSGAMVGKELTKMFVSTPSAKSGYFWDILNSDNNLDIEQLCVDVSEGKKYKDIPGLYWFVDKKGTVKLIIHFLAHPIYNKNPDYLNYRLEQDATDYETIQREYNLRFVDSSVSVFDSALVRDCAVGSWEEYDSTAVYYAGLDTSTTGNDYCSLPIFKFKENKLSLVYLYRKRKETSDYHLYHIGELIKKYHIKTVGIEVTGGVGQIYLEQLERQFPKVLFEAIRTTGDSKPVMISNLQLAMERKQLIYPAMSPLIDELLSFRRIGRKLEAATGKHDDVVMSSSFTVTISPLFQEEKRGLFGNDKLFKNSLHLG
ncbi:MAG: terminase family protein [Cyanobacteria bacterium P01_A01_bin.45]